MKQLQLLTTGEIADVDGMVDRKREGISYIGQATKQFDGTWRCLANVGGMLCLVEVKIDEAPTT